LFRRRNSVDVATRDGGPLVIEIVRFSDLPSEPREGK